MTTSRTSFATSLVIAAAAVLAGGAAVAQTAPANNKAAAKPAPAEKAKSGGKLMTRDELRNCMTTNQVIDDETASLKTKETEVKAERDSLKAFKADQDKAEADLTARSAALKADIDGVKAFGAEIEAGASKMEKAELKAKQEEYTARANALQPRIDAFNAERNGRSEKYKGFNERVDAQAKALDDFNERVEVLAEKRTKWKMECGNRSYDEKDEIAIKKELEAAKK